MKIKTRDMILIAFFAAMTAAGAIIKMPIPISNVPITLQFFFTMLSGIVLGARLGALSQLVYVLLGLIGIPVFASGGGPSYVYNPAFGYLLGFILASYVTGWIAHCKMKESFLKTLLACLLGLTAMYFIALPYFYMVVKFNLHSDIAIVKLLKTGFLIFLPGDIIKCIAVSAVGVKILPLIKRNF